MLPCRKYKDPLHQQGIFWLIPKKGIMRDKYSDERIDKLHPKVRQVFTDFINECEETFNVTLRVVQGYRTFEEQDALYAKGRGAGGSVVTNARGGQSFHNYGLAIDVCAMVGNDKEVDWNYNTGELEPIAKKHGITWGGTWAHIKDKPHFEMNFGHGSSGFNFFLQLHTEGKVDAQGYVIF
jgi:hypothetical protein